MAQSEKVKREIELAFRKREAEVETQKDRDWARHEKQARK
jgi:hypothetical protein